VANDINQELEFQERFGKMSGRKRFDWMVKEIFFMSIKLHKVTDCYGSVEKRVSCLENQLGIDNTPGKPKTKPSLKYVAYGGIGTVGASGVIYAAIELIGKLVQRGG
jgi:hypothetical protein